jgi:hypothetical protein
MVEVIERSVPEVIFHKWIGRQKLREQHIRVSVAHGRSLQSGLYGMFSNPQAARGRTGKMHHFRASSGRISDASVSPRTGGNSVMAISLDHAQSSARPTARRALRQTTKAPMKPRRVQRAGTTNGATENGEAPDVPVFEGSLALSFSNRRESDWFPIETPPVVEGIYVTRGVTGLGLHVFIQKRWTLARGEASPFEWRGIDVSLTDEERHLLFTRFIHQKDIVAAVPLLRDAAASYLAGSAVPHRSLTERQQHMNMLLNACWCYLTVERSGLGALLNEVDRHVFQPALAALPVLTLKTIEERVAAFENGVDQ